MAFISRIENYGENFYERYYLNYRRHGIARILGKKMCREIVMLDERLDAEIESTIVESLNGRVASEYSFEVSEGHIVAADGEKIITLLERALDVAHAKSRDDPYYAEFLPARTQNELYELQVVEALTKNPLQPAAVCVFSPYSEEYDYHDGKLDRAFQRPDCKRAMVRITFWDCNKIHIVTRSLDYASVSLLAKTAQKALGYSFKAAHSTQMQGEIIPLNPVDYADILLIADKVVDAFDEIKFTESGVKTSQGRSIHEDTDLQLAVVEKCVSVKESAKSEIKRAARYALHADDFKRDADRILFNHIALAESVLNGRTLSNDVTSDAYFVGLEAAGEGRSYNACGVVIDGGNSQAIAVASTGYESLMLLSKKLIGCPSCHSKVVVEDKLLKEGILHCKECGNTVDVCGDKAKESRFKKQLAKKTKRHTKPSIYKRSLFEILFGTTPEDTRIKKRNFPF